MKRTFIKKSIFTILAAILSVANSFGQTAITTGALSPTEVCAGGNITVPFTTTGTIAPLTNFIAQLSDAAGAFTTPVNIGSAEASPITAIIPVGTVAGAAYKVRVISVLAAVTIATGSESAALKVNAIPAAPTVTSPVAYEVGATPVALAASGTGLKWYNAGTGGTGSTTIPVPDTKTEGTQNFFVSQTVSGCESARSEIVVNVTKTACTPPAKPVVADKNYTIGDPEEALTATGTNLKWYAAASGGSPLASAPKPSTAAAGKTSYFVSQTVNECESERAEIVVTVSACTPPAKPGVANKSYTVGDPEQVLTATGTNLKWYAAASGGSPLASAPKPSTATAGTTSYYVSQTVGGCESERAEIVVTVSACTPPAKPGVANKSYAVGDPEQVLTATGTNLKWYAAASGGSPLASAPKPSTATAGTTSYYVSQTVGGCESERAEIVVTVSACTPPAKPGVANKSYTIGDPEQVLTATGTNLKWYSNASGGSPLASAPKPSTATAGTTSYYVSQTVGGCESERAEIVVTVSACTPPAKPGVANKSYTIGDPEETLTATGTNLKWYANATGGSPLASAPKPSTATAGTRSYFVSQTVGGCESARAEIVVSVSACTPPAKPTVSAIDPVCMYATVPSSLLSSAVSQKTGLKWYDSATGGTGSTTVPTPSTTTAGIKVFYVTQTVNKCESERAAVSFEVKALPERPTVSNLEYCKDVTNAVPLTASGTGLKWYATETGGSPLAGAPKPSTTTVGTVSYFVSQTAANGLSCESPRAELKVTVNALPVALQAISEALCQERADKVYNLAAQPSGGNTVNWYTTPTGGTASKNAPSVNLKNAGETIAYATQVSAKGCESPLPRAVQKVRVKPLPGLPGVEKPLVEICQFVAAQPLSATPVTGGILKWYGTNASGGDPSDNAPIPSTAEGGTTSYFVGQALEGCIGDRAKIDVKINTTPKPQTTTQLAYCQNEVAPRLDATGSILKWYRNANDTEFQGIPFTPFTEKVQDYSFFVTQTGTNGCESPKEEIRIHIKALPSATISGNSTIDLGQTATIRIRFTGDGPWIYALSDGTTDTTDQQNHEIQVKPTTTTSYLLTNVANACGKGLPIGSALVTVKVPTINSGNPSVAEACAGKTFSVPFQQSGDFPTENTFKVQIATENTDAKFVSIPSVASSNIITATFPDTTLAGSYYVRVVSSGTNPNFTVKGSVSSITITASPLPIATITGTQTILVGDKADMKIATTGKAPWTFTLSDGKKDSLITAAVTPYTFKLAPKTTTTYTITKVTNVCGTGKGAGTARVQVDPILGVEPPASADWVNVYPTLVTSQCTVELKGAISLKEASAEVIDLTGRSRAVKTISQKTTEVDFSSFPSGLYLLRVTNGNKNTVWRIMKP
ncbi:T9SS type A sorting domain-containing protein [Dyadobacter chenwenxiniae]|uniref:T9SS type A sorting domain-containing protein n=1 Tax=Dyadobacter chenwenxiniae TaxID=2906456 RepID=A0A9X1PJZ9_9BACT|nr:T9SS type A sorting domain-containing protein [Dyadobacter chenwenxiniae]MCF0061790.1 T9SS type A sorting domain-containing protein [Dyadobacter chenwenxiniae]UON81607.1 T9SS type A sorting domain-containing protein [Dyadobacter chenwenxiniae]